MTENKVRFWRPLVLNVLVVLRAVLVVPTAVIFSLADQGPDANIGRVLAGPLLLAFGLPWPLAVTLVGD